MKSRKNNIVNPKAEYGALKDGVDFATMDWSEDPGMEQWPTDEHEAKRRRGQILMRIIKNFPNRMPDDKLKFYLKRFKEGARALGGDSDMEDMIEKNMSRLVEISDNQELNSEQLAKIEILREKVVDMAEVNEGMLSQEFPSGVYLFHGAKVEQVKDIFESGRLLNVNAIYEEKVEALRKELQWPELPYEMIEQKIAMMSVVHNTGQEGISWSANGIDVLPGTRGHIAGFVAAPEDVLGSNKLVVPSRSAPYELLQVDLGMDTKRFFDAKMQSEVYGQGGINLIELITVEDGMMRLIFDIDKTKNSEDKSVESFLLKYASRGGLPADKLRKHFEITENGRIKLDGGLFQQELDDNLIPPAAVWLQGMKDQGKFDGTDLDGLEVNEIISKAFHDEEVAFGLLDSIKDRCRMLKEEYQAELEKVGNVAAPVEKMYFVTSHRDLEDWLKEIVKSDHLPKGILLYDDDLVMRENFAEKTLGNHDELSREISYVVGADGDFWREKMGMDVGAIPRAGHSKHVLADRYVEHNKEVVINDGKLAVREV